MKPRLALCIPARNEEAVLPRLLHSVDRQTLPFDEVLVYDDGSTDRTGEIAETWGATVVRVESSTGPSRGKNRLATHTPCEWLHFHDADDALHPEFVARARRWIERDDADVVLFATEDRSSDGSVPLGTRVWDDAALREDPVRYGILHTITNCGMYRRTSFLDAGGFDGGAATKYNEDQAMHLRLAYAGLRFRADPLVGIYIYRRAASMSSNHRIECARARYEVLRDAADRTDARYAREIGANLWRLAGELGGYSDWRYVRACLSLASRLGYRDPVEEHWGVRAGARISPLGIVALREAFVRLLKPALRAGTPRVGASSTGLTTRTAQSG